MIISPFITGPVLKKPLPTPLVSSFALELEENLPATPSTENVVVVPVGIPAIAPVKPKRPALWKPRSVFSWQAFVSAPTTFKSKTSPNAWYANFGNFLKF